MAKSGNDAVFSKPGGYQQTQTNFFTDETNFTLSDGQVLATTADVITGLVPTSTGSGRIKVTGADGIQTITGTQGNDELAGGDGFDTIVGGDGNDIITGGAGKDSLTGGSGDDTFVYGNTATELVIYANNDANTANVEHITDLNANDDVIQFTAGAATPLAGITLVADTTGFTINMNDGEFYSLASGLSNIDALTAAMQAAAVGVASTAGAASPTTGIQIYLFQTVAGAGGFDGKTFLVINDAIATLTSDDVIIDITGVAGTLTSANFSIA